MSTRALFAAASVALAAVLPWQSHAATYDFSFAGPGISGAITLTYGDATDANFPGQGFIVTGISGLFTDTNNGLNIVDAVVEGLVPVTHDTPHADNTIAPDNFSRFAVASGLAPQNGGTLSYTNLVYPGGSPQTASDYPFHGGPFDVYGLLFSIGNGRFVNLWSDGLMPGATAVAYGVAVVTPEMALDYQFDTVAAVPEPATIGMLSGGLLLVGFCAARRRRSMDA